jgi:hypothetical protein
VAAQALLRKREIAVALEAAKNWRLVVVVFNYFYLSSGLGREDLPYCDSVKIIPVFEVWAVAMPMKIKVLTM